MEGEDKKPDSYVENAKLLPYGSNIGAPSIKIENIDGWKQYNASKVNKVFQSKYEELKNEYLKFIEEYEWNSLIYSAQYNFEPVVGETYHLYKRNNDEYFLSIILVRKAFLSFSTNSFRLIFFFVSLFK